jgi:hypothetical protein
MSNKLHYFIGIVLFLSLTPIRGMSQTTDDQTAGAAKVENTQTKHVVKKQTNSSTKQAVGDAYHATAHATKKAWNGTKRATAKGYHATAHATKKAWTGTKQAASKGYHTAAHATKKAWTGTKKAVSKGYHGVTHTPAKAEENSNGNRQEEPKPKDDRK